MDIKEVLHTLLNSGWDDEYHVVKSMCDKIESLRSQLAETQDKLHKIRDAANVALGHMTGGRDGDWRDCDPVEILQEALE